MEYSLNQQGETAHLTLIGLINEDAEFAFQSIAPEVKDAKKIVFNFAQIKSINSLGVRAWVSFLRSIEEGREIIFSECTGDVIMQVNMIPSFLGKGRIESFYVSYICEVCNKTEKKLLETAKIAPKTIPSSVKCDSEDCGMQTEELEEEYFVFLTR